MTTGSLTRWMLGGAWLGMALALIIGLLQGHSPAYCVLNALKAAIPLAGMGALIASVPLMQPPPENRMQHLLQTARRQLSDDELKALLKSANLHTP